MAVPYTFGTATAAIPLSQLDSNFSTAVTIGNTAVQLGNTVTTLNNLTLANVTISSGNVTITNVAVTTANVSGTANVSSLVVLTNETVLGNTAVTGNVTASINVTGAKLIPTGTSVTGNGLYLPAANALGLSTNGTNAVYIDSSQNVGIGTSSVAVTYTGSTTYNSRSVISGNGVTIDPLCLQGNGTQSYLSFSNLNSNSANFRYAVVGATMTTTTAGSEAGVLQFFTSSAGTNAASNERMRIDSSGNLLVGRTSSFAAGQGSSPSLQVSTAGSSGIALTNGSNALFIYRDNTNQITYFYNGSNQASLSAAGAWTNASDAKLKKEITTIKYGLDTVLATQPRSYKRVDVDGDYVGFVAQELKEQVPEVVFGSDTVQYSVDYGSLVAVAFKAIQELKALADTQASTITSLTTRITALEAK